MKSYQERFYKFSALMLVPALIAACGGGDTSGGPPLGGGGGGGGDPTVNPPHTITITAPVSDAVDNKGGGVYRRKGTVIVTDSEGNSVADGTRVNLFVIDSILASGAINAGTDSISGTALTDMAPLLGDGVTATTFDAASVNRNDTFRYITPNDHVLLISNAEEADKARLVSTTALSNNVINVSSTYVNSYPNTIYDGITDITNYVVGASLLGAYIEGDDGTRGSVVTQNGNALFWLVYPANINTANTGCGSVPAIDDRALPIGSADVYVIAQVADNANVSIIDQNFCFSVIANGTVTPAPATLSSSDSVTVTVRDGGDTFRVPFTSVTATVVTTGTVSVTVDNPSYVTDASGSFVSAVTVAGGASGDTATITYTKANEPSITGVVTVTVP